MINPQTKSKLMVWNKTFLGAFLSLITIVILLRLVTSTFLDLGYWNGKFHLGYLDGSPESQKFLDSLKVDGQLPYSWQIRIIRHPNFFWSFTQFTWWTTMIVLIIVFFRFMKKGEIKQTWLRWLANQRTLSLVTMYDLVVMVIFWIGIAPQFNKAFSTDSVLRPLELSITILVHTIIPSTLLIYSLVYLVKGNHAWRLNDSYILRGLIYPAIYGVFYVLIAFIWDDPYPITDLIHNGEQWWMLVVLGFTIYIMLGLMIIIHNMILFKWNRNYNYRNDWDLKQQLAKRITKKVLKEMKHKPN